MEKNLVQELKSISAKLQSNVGMSSFEKALEVFEEVQVHTGCGGCYGTQIDCAGPGNSLGG